MFAIASLNVIALAVVIFVNLIIKVVTDTTASYALL